MIKYVLISLAAVMLAACAKTPSSIAPIAVASAEYNGQSCRQLTAELVTVSAKLEEVEQKQRNKVAGDAAGVFFVLIPPSALTGDFAADVARYKGEKIAIERALKKAKCS